MLHLAPWGHDREHCIFRGNLENFEKERGRMEECLKVRREEPISFFWMLLEKLSICKINNRSKFLFQIHDGSFYH